jgi:hypothetical protein
MTKRQTKFGRPDVNDAPQVSRFVLNAMAIGSPKAQITGGEAASVWHPRVEDNALHPFVQRLGWRGFAVRKNFGNYRRKFINTGARHDDAVAAAVSFLCDTQEPAALIFPELDIKVLALDLQFFGFDDVVHFALRARV